MFTVICTSIIHHLIQSIIQKWTKWGWVGYAQGKVQKRSPYKDGRSCKHLKAALSSDCNLKLRNWNLRGLCYKSKKMIKMINCNLTDLQHWQLEINCEKDLFMRFWFFRAPHFQIRILCKFNLKFRHLICYATYPGLNDLLFRSTYMIKTSVQRRDNKEHALKY